MPGPTLFDKLEEIERKLRRQEWAGGATEIYQAFLWSQEGFVSVGLLPTRVYVRGTYTIDTVRVSVASPPVSVSCIVDVLKNGTSLWSSENDQPTIGTGSYYDDATPDSDRNTLADGDYIDAYVDQAAGQNLTVHVYVIQDAIE